MNRLEQAEQIALFSWIEIYKNRMPELELAFHIPNGGQRSAAEARIFKSMGVKPGVSDIFLPVARASYHGLWIEMKAKKGKTSNYQDDWLKKMKAQGYATAVCYDWESAAEILQSYLKSN